MITYILLAIGLSMDSMAVSIGNGMNYSELKIKYVLRNSLVFAMFQAVMPLLGWYIGARIEELIQAWDHWIAFAILLFLGVKMISEANSPQEKEHSYTKLFSQAFATSIDAFAVGISLAIVDSPILEPVIIIGIVTFLFSFVGHLSGKTIGKLIRNKIEWLGGIILILIGTKILIEHLHNHF